MPPKLDPCIKQGKARGSQAGAPRLANSIVLFLALISWPVPASAQRARITNLSDVNFGLVTGLQSDARRTQNVCLFSNSGGSRYSVTATGSGAGSSFMLSSGSGSIAYEVEWSDQPGQTTGTSLASGVAATGRVSSATQQSCNSGPPTSASLIVILRSAALVQAREGSYSGSLTLLVAAE